MLHSSKVENHHTINRHVYFLLLLFVSALLNTASANEKLFNLANSAFKSGNYQQAIKLYDSLNTLTGPNYVIYYNLGNCYYKSGNLGKAILYYEKSLKYKPGDEDAEHNLRVARARTVDKIDTVPGFFVFRWIEAVTASFTIQGWFRFSLILLYLLAALIIGFIFTANQILRRWLLLPILPVFILFILSLLIAVYGNYTESNAKKAIVVESSVNIKYAPDENSSDAFIVHEGLKIKIEDRVDRWYKIRLEDGKTGWVKENSIEII